MGIEDFEKFEKNSSNINIQEVPINLISEKDFSPRVQPLFNPQVQNLEDKPSIHSLSKAIDDGHFIEPIILGYIEGQGEFVVVDGYFRLSVYKKKGEDMLNAIIYKYENESEVIADAIARNSFHGEDLSQEDKVKITAKLILEHNEKITIKELANRLNDNSEKYINTRRYIYTLRVMKILNSDNEDWNKIFNLDQDWRKLLESQKDWINPNKGEVYHRFITNIFFKGTLLQEVNNEEPPNNEESIKDLKEFYEKHNDKSSVKKIRDEYEAFVKNKVKQRNVSTTKND